MLKGNSVLVLDSVFRFYVCICTMVIVTVKPFQFFEGFSKIRFQFLEFSVSNCYYLLPSFSSSSLLDLKEGWLGSIFTCEASQYLILCDITAATTPTTTPPRFLKFISD